MLYVIVTSVKAIPFFSRQLSNTFPDFGSVGRKRKKEVEKNWEKNAGTQTQYLNIISTEPVNDKTRLENPHGDNGGRKHRRRD